MACTQNFARYYHPATILFSLPNSKSYVKPWSLPSNSNHTKVSSENNSSRDIWSKKCGISIAKLHEKISWPLLRISWICCCFYYYYYCECTVQVTVPTATNERIFSNINRASLVGGREGHLSPPPLGICTHYMKNGTRLVMPPKTFHPSTFAPSW